MTLREVSDLLNARIRQKQDEIYILAAMVRSAFSDSFPKSADAAFGRETDGDWHRSYNYMKALQEKRRCMK